MKPYFYDGLLPDSFLGDLIFTKMINHRDGTLKEAFDSAVTEVTSEHQELLYAYSYEFELYVDEYLKNSRKGQATLNSALSYACKTYFFEDCLRYNIFTFLENYVECLLYEQGFNIAEIDRIRSYLFRFVEYQILDTRLDLIVCQVQRFALTHKLP